MRLRRAILPFLTIVLLSGALLFASCSGLRCIVSSHRTYKDQEPPTFADWPKDDPVDNSVAAVVLSQPALPFPLTAAARASLGVDLDRFKKKAWNGHVLAIRFEKDCLAAPERFETMCDNIPKDHLTIHVVPTDKPCAHSVLTLEGQHEGGAVHGAAQAAIHHTTCFLAKHLTQSKEECRDESDRPCHAD